MTRALIARLDSAGDVLVSGPAVRAIAADPAIDEVVMLCGTQGSPAARLLPGVDRVITWNAPWIVDPAPGATREHVKALDDLLADALPDIAILLTSFHQSPLPLALLLRLAGVERIVGASVDYAGSLLDVRLKPGETLDEDQPEPERALAIAAAGGFTLPADDHGRLAILPPPPATDLVGTGPYLVVHPGAAVPARAWPAPHARELVRLLVDGGHRVVVTGGPGERELTAEVADGVALDLGGATDLHGLAGVLQGAAVVITGNTGPAHLAAAVGTPIVSLFAPVVPAIRWAPYGVPLALLGDQEAPCRGSRARECPVAGHPCLSDVSPETVLDAALRLAASSGRPVSVPHPSYSPTPEEEVIA